MKIEPKNYIEALGLFIDLPFYKISDLIKKNSVSFQDQDVYVRFYSNQNSRYRLYIKNEKYDGYLIVKGVYDKYKWSEVEVKDELLSYRDDLKWIFDLFFNRYSPLHWNFLILIILLMLQVLITYYFFNLSKDEVYNSNFCNRNCLINTFHYVSTLYYFLILYIAIILSSLYFIFYKIKKIKSIQLSGCIFTMSCLYLIISLINGVGIINKMLTPDFSISNRIIFNPEYYKKEINRKAASELDLLFDQTRRNNKVESKYNKIKESN